MNYKRIILFAVLSIIVLAGGYTQISKIGLIADAVNPEPHVPDRMITSRQAVQWSLEQWTGDDTPYQAIRKDVDDEIAHGADPAQLRRDAWPQAEKQPQDSQAQFLWAYCASKTVGPDAPAIAAPASPFMAHLQTTSLMIYQLSRAPDPKTYNYARLLYLGLSADDYNLAAFGERLLRQDPKDNEVKCHLVDDYAGRVSLIGFHTKRIEPILQNRALELAHQLVSSSPKSAAYWTILGSVYSGAYYISHNPNDAKKGTVAYQKYLQLAPEKDEFRPQAQIIIKELQEGQSNQ